MNLIDVLKKIFSKKETKNESATDIAFENFFKSLQVFYLNPNDENVYKAYDCILKCIVAGCSTMVPCDIADDGVKYDLYKSDRGWSYIICTNPSEISKCKGKSNTFQTYLSIFERASKDTGVNGIVFDPYNSSGKTLHCSIAVCKKMIDAYRQLKASS